MNKTQIVTKAHDIETKWQRFKKKRSVCERSGQPMKPEDDEYLSSGKRDRMLDDFIYLFWLLTDKCFREDDEMKKLAFVVSKSKRMAR
jgi:hypothetical protein